MKESCMQKVREKFAVLPEEEITKHSAYVDCNGKFCFNAMVLDICAGLQPLPENNNRVTDRLLQEGIYEQDDTYRIIDLVHTSFIDERMDFDEAVNEVLDILSNDGHNDYDYYAETNFEHDEYYDDDDDDW